MPRPAAWCEHELAQVRAEKQALQTEIERLRTLNDSMQTELERHMREKVELAGLVAKERATIERLTTELTGIHDDGRCPSWICQRIETALEPKP